MNVVEAMGRASKSLMNNIIARKEKELRSASQ
jgi:hypothetical protein